MKKTSLNEFSNVRKGGIIAIGIEPGDTLIEVKLTRGSTGEGDPGDDVVLITKDGMSIRFHEADVRSMGRAAGGVRGISLGNRRCAGRGRRLWSPTPRCWWPARMASASARALTNTASSRAAARASSP